ncbi:Nodulation-signaling pathway 1 protein [Platanthera zijinensis]|uniref:Nodulation-signaling pathway 1 protein n=1 Tax=Platanthera zijinensis TaxID=2320716 RepID=A0AAP0GCG7_9ASPA
MDWMEDSISFFPTFLDDPYYNDIPHFDWWSQDQNQNQSFPVPAAPPAAVDPQLETPKSEFCKKRKLPANPPAVQRRRTGNEGSSEKKTHGKGSGGNAGGISGGSREARWAEQLLNPLAAAIGAGNVSRVQHLLYVLQELASPTGDANHRLAFYGLQALTRRPAGGYVMTEARAFRSAVIKFHEVSPWFAVPNCLANAAIMSAAAEGNRLHVVDAGVSHGVQWPTLLEALTRRAGGPPAMRLTVVGAGATAPFGSAPAGYDFGPQLMRYAKSIDLDLKVERGEAGGRREGEETVVVCAQFRAGRAGLGFLRAVREMEPDLVVLSEGEEGEGEGFGRRAELMWKFLESTSAAFKGKECEERRAVEGEAARVLEEGEAWEADGGGGRERWRERMGAAGFKEKGFGEEAVEAGRALLRKFDGNWEMRSAGDGAVGLWWKGQPVSFCSLWKPIWHKAAAADMTYGGGSITRH